MTVLFFAGGEAEQLTKDLLANGVKNILYSFYYLHLFGRYQFIDRITTENPGVRFFLDSGAFTFANKPEKTKERFGSRERYLDAYVDFIDRYGDRFCRIAEPDFDTGDMDTDEVDTFRDTMLRRWPNLPIMPVYHQWREKSAWEEYCADPRIKCLGIGMGTYTIGELRQLCLAAHAVGKPVHGFGMTKIRTTMRSVPFDSVDSSTWLQGQRFGTMFVFQGSVFKNVHTGAIGGKENRKLHKKYFEGIGCDFKKILEDDKTEVRKANIIAWRNLSARLEVMRRYQMKLLPVDLDSTPAGTNTSVQRVPLVAVPREPDLTKTFGRKRDDPC